MFLAPMSETLLSAGDGSQTWLTRLRTHLVLMDPGGAMCTRVAFSGGRQYP